MLSNLIKYETRATGKMLCLCWIALLIMSAIVGSVMNMSETFDGLGVFGEISSVVTMMLYVAIFTAMVVLTVVIVISRFYKGLYGDEGYLMNTLPVKAWQLITSKGIVATIAVVIGIVVGALSIIIVTLCVGGGNLIGSFFKGFGQVISADPVVILILVELFIVGVVGVVKTVYQIYAALAIGQLANRYRILLSVGAYLGINVVLVIIASLCGIVTDGFEEIWIDLSSLDTAFIGFLTVALVIELIQVVAFHIVAERITNKKLNLL